MRTREEERDHPQAHASSTPVQPEAAAFAPSRRSHPLKRLQRAVGNQAVLRAGAAEGRLPSTVQEGLSEPGRPLDPSTRAFMESRFAHDFSGVRVHQDARASESAEAVDASAYTVGEDVVLGGGRPSPGSAGGRRLLAHELAHVLQQSRGGEAPTVDPSALHERDAEAAATAVAAGQPSVSVQQSTGVGLARQPKPAGSSADIDIDKFLTLPKVTDPRSSPRYVDKLFESVTYSWFNGASVFHWKENGKDQHVGVPLTDLEQDDTLSFTPILDIYNSKAEAMKVVQSYPVDPKKSKIYTFYRTPDNVIMPTCFSIASTPEFHKLWPGLKKGIAEDAADIRRGLVPIANAINPIPGTKVDEHGDLSLSSNPLDWLALLRLRRLSELKKAGPITRRLHSGHDVQYTVLGPHGKLSGTSVYVLRDAEGTVLYVGKGYALERLREHIKDVKKTQWFGEISRIEVRATGLTNTQALALEESLIGELKPSYNVDQNPFRKEFGNTMEVGPNLPPTQQILTFWLEWGHDE